MCVVPIDLGVSSGALCTVSAVLVGGYLVGGLFELDTEFVLIGSSLNWKAGGGVVCLLVFLFVSLATLELFPTDKKTWMLGRFAIECETANHVAAQFS